MASFHEAGPVDGTPEELRVWYINLDSRPDRRKRMERVLERHGLAECATRISAITPDDPRIKDLMAEAPDGLNGRLWACGLSHFEAWRRIADSRRDGDDTRILHLILEDDITFFKGWRAEMSRLVSSKLPEGWEILYLDCMPTMDGWRLGPRIAEDCPLGTRVELEGPVDGVVFADAYLITADTAAELLRIHDAEPFANAETVLSELQRRGRCFATMPRLALQTWLDSSIQPDRRVGGFHSFFTETYHARYPTTLYDYDST